MNVLRDITVLITRPQQQAQHLKNLIENRGGKTIIFPSLEITTPNSLTSLQNAIKKFQAYKIAIFNSANAVHFALMHGFQTHPTLKIIAIGPGTARELHRHSIEIESLPSSYSSEGILQLPLLNKVHNKELVIFCGENSRPLLCETLKSRGALVDVAVCYKRQIPQNIDQKLLSQMRKHQDIQIALSYSMESLKNFSKLIDIYQLTELKLIPLLVISNQMYQLAHELGWNKIIVTPNASDEAVMDVLIKWQADKQILTNF